MREQKVVGFLVKLCVGALTVNTYLYILMKLGRMQNRTGGNAIKHDLMNHVYGSAESLKKLNCLFKRQLFAINCRGCFTSPRAARHHMVHNLVSGGKKKTCGLLKLQIMTRLIMLFLTLGSFLTIEIKDKGEVSIAQQFFFFLFPPCKLKHLT